MGLYTTTFEAFLPPHCVSLTPVCLPATTAQQPLNNRATTGPPVFFLPILPLLPSPQLLCMTPDCLSKLLLGLAHLGLDPGPAWLGLAAAAALEACPRMTGWQAAATVHAFALLGYKVREGMEP